MFDNSKNSRIITKKIPIQDYTYVKTWAWENASF